MKYNLTMKQKKNIVDWKKDSQDDQTPNTIGICSCCVLDRPVFELSQILLIQSWLRGVWRRHQMETFSA